MPRLLTPEEANDLFWKVNPGRNATVPSLYLMDFANAVLAEYGGVAERELIEAKREGWDARHMAAPGWMSNKESHAWRDQSYPLPAPPAPEPVLTDEDVSHVMHEVWVRKQEAGNLSKDGIVRAVERAVLSKLAARGTP